MDSKEDKSGTKVNTQRGRVASVSRVKELLSLYNLRAKKSFGQNFLIEESVVEKIVSALSLKNSDVVLEIGPGLGALTQALLEHNSNVVAIELDRDMAHILEETLKVDFRNLQIINHDFLKTPWESLGATKIVGNLPYYITTPIISRILKANTPWETMVFTLQWEVVQKLTAKPTDKNYNALSAALQCFGEPRIIAKLPPHFFLPQPDVYSGVVLVERRSLDIASETLVFLWEVLDNAFRLRRKTLQNNLAAIIPPGFKSSVDLNRRAESLSYKEFLNLAEELKEYSKDR